MEIERKFLPARIPDNLDSYEHVELEQGYISTMPVIRIRKKSTARGEAHILTVKSNGMMSRQEYELEISAEEYSNLLHKVDGNIIKKTRYMIPLSAIEASSDIDISGLTLELDIFHDAFEGLVLGEIEFPNEKNARDYVPSDFFKEETTYDRRFHNNNMSSMSASDIKAFIEGL